MKLTTREKYARRIKRMMNEDYKEFIKALIHIEKNENDEEILERVYDDYMEGGFGLLNENFTEKIDEHATELGYIPLF